MSSIFTTTYFLSSNQKARERLLSLLKEAASQAEKSERNILRYFIYTQEQPSDSLYLFTVIEYTTQSALEDYVAKPGAKGLQSTIETEHLIQGAPEIHTLPATITFTRPETSTANLSAAFIILATFAYKPGTVSQALDGWTDLIEYTRKSEPLTLSYTAMEDKAEDVIRTVEVYQNKEFVYDVHVKSPAIARSKEQNGAFRIPPGTARDVMKGFGVGGWLFRRQ